MSTTPPVVSADQAVELISSGDRVYIHEAAMAPHELLDALARRAPELTGVETISIHTEGPAPYVAPEMAGHIRHNALFIGANVREAVNDGRADYTPVFLSNIPRLIANGALGLDVALLQVSPPDRHGYCRLGLSVAIARAAADHATNVIGLVNRQVPLTLGNTAVHLSRFDALVDVDRPLPLASPAPLGETERAIGRHVAALIPNRATIQTGIGSIPDAVLDALRKHEDLGMHTEMFSDGVIALAEAGVITNRFKNTWRDRIVTSFAMGSERVNRFVESNPFVEFHSSDIVNDTREIRRIENMIAVNSAIEIDLAGQVAADSIGTRLYSGIGGQMDFLMGARLAPGGKAIIAMPAATKNGTISKIVPTITPGGGVVTTRGHVQWVATEHGVVNLEGQSLRRRAELLISIAHPDAQSELRQAALARHFSLPPSDRQASRDDGATAS